MIQASELHVDWSRNILSFRESLVTIVTHEGFLVALEQINFVKTLLAAERTAMHQFDAVPSMHAAGKAVK
jgi:hypothetical protein